MEDENSLPPRPPAPSDPDALHTIQKLAEYVVKQGPEFEDHTKRNKANDPQFDFLFGRDLVGYHFYEWMKRSLGLKQRSKAENTPEEEPSPPGTSSGRKDRRLRGESDMNEKESKKMRHASPTPDHSQSNGDGNKKKSSSDPRRDQEMKLHADPRREQQRGDPRDAKDPRCEQQYGDTRDMKDSRRDGDPRRQLGREQEAKQHVDTRREQQHAETKRHGDPRHEQHQGDPRRDLDSKQQGYPRRELGNDEAGREAERKRARSPEQRKRNRSRSRSPYRRNSRSPRRRSRSKSPVREHKRGDPRANAARSREICYDYSRGRCNKGSSCKYIHEEPDEKGKRDDWGSSQDRQRSSRDLRDRDSRDARDPRGDPRHNHSRDSRDHPREPTKEPANKDAHAGLQEHHREHRGEENQQRGIIEDRQNSQPSQQSDYFQSLNQWPQGVASIASNASYHQNGSMTASLQALQEQHFQLPTPPPPPPLTGLEALAVKVSAAPLVNPSGLFMEGQPKQQENAKEGQKTEDTDKKSPENRQPTADSDDNQNGEGDAEEESNHKSKKASMLVRLAVTEYVKEVLKPTWKGGHLSKEMYKTIAKKAVDKVIGTLQSHQIPRTPEKVEHFMEFSRQKISKLVQGYVEKYNK